MHHNKATITYLQIVQLIMIFWKIIAHNKVLKNPLLTYCSLICHQASSIFVNIGSGNGLLHVQCQA